MTTEERDQFAIDFMEWSRRYSLYDYSKHPYKYCAAQQPNGGRGKIPTWTAKQLLELYLKSPEYINTIKGEND
jgi:hypothetical protein